MIGDHRYPNAVMSIAEDMENQAGPKYDLSAASRRMLADLHYSYPEAGIDRLVEANGTNAMQIGFKNAFASLDVRHSPY